MNPQDNNSDKPNQQPISPDAEVYDHPVPGASPQIVYVTRPHEPIKPQLSDEQRRRHEESKKKYPGLNLSEGEFVISAIHRHPIGLLQIWAVVGMVVFLCFLGAYLFAGSSTLSAGAQPLVDPLVAAIPALLVTALAVLFGFIATSIYQANRFYLTNESVIQQIQTGLFHKREQTISLDNIEDASYNQHGVLPHILNYGLLRLSTEGDETTYRFNYASDPENQIRVLNNAVEAFKLGRPVTTDN